MLRYNLSGFKLLRIFGFVICKSKYLAYQYFVSQNIKIFYQTLFEELISNLNIIQRGF